jgi:hypothetical protein
MGKSPDEVMAALPAARRRRIEAHAAELIAEEMTLRELRKAMGKTQAQLARRLGKPQAAISRMEPHDAKPVEGRHEPAYQVRVETGEQAVSPLQHGHLGAGARCEVGELRRDVAAADQDDAVG